MRMTPEQLLDVAVSAAGLPSAWNGAHTSEELCRSNRTFGLDTPS